MLGEPAVDPVGAPFDTVVCSNGLENVEDAAAALAQMHDLLAPGGRVVLIVPMLRVLCGAIDRAIHHHRRYERAEIEAKLAGAGFAIERIQPFNAIGVPGATRRTVSTSRASGIPPRTPCRRGSTRRVARRSRMARRDVPGSPRRRAAASRP